MKIKKCIIPNSKFKIAQKGQALVMLLVFMAITITIVAGAVAVIIINSQTTGKYALGEEVLHVAEAGADNAILRLLRDPSYSGETLTIGNGTATITVIGGFPLKNIVSEGRINNLKRKILVLANYSNNVFTILGWREID